MIEQIKTNRDDLLEFQVSGAVTDADYKNVLIPAIETAIQQSDRIRMLIRFESGFKDFTLGAMMDDARLGLKHWRGFDRVAIATDNVWLKRSLKAFSIFMPCPVMTFPLNETDDARRWLVESLGSVHQKDLGNGVLHVQLMGKLESAALEEEAKDMNAFIARNERFRLLLDLREFDGWQGLAALGEHLKVVRDHHDLADRAAIVGDAGWQKMGERLLSRFVKGRTKFFKSSEFDAAVTWVKSDAGSAETAA